MKKKKKLLFQRFYNRNNETVESRILHLMDNIRKLYSVLISERDEGCIDFSMKFFFF